MPREYGQRASWQVRVVRCAGLPLAWLVWGVCIAWRSEELEGEPREAFTSRSGLLGRRKLDWLGLRLVEHHVDVRSLRLDLNLSQASATRACLGEAVAAREAAEDLVQADGARALGQGRLELSRNVRLRWAGAAQCLREPSCTLPVRGVENKSRHGE